VSFIYLLDEMKNSSFDDSGKCFDWNDVLFF